MIYFCCGGSNINIQLRFFSLQFVFASNSKAVKKIKVNFYINLIFNLKCQQNSGTSMVVPPDIKNTGVA